MTGDRELTPNLTLLDLKDIDTDACLSYANATYGYEEFRHNTGENMRKLRRPLFPESSISDKVIAKAKRLGFYGCGKDRRWLYGVNIVGLHDNENDIPYHFKASLRVLGHMPKRERIISLMVTMRSVFLETAIRNGHLMTVYTYLRLYFDIADTLEINLSYAVAEVCKRGDLNMIILLHMFNLVDMEQAASHACRNDQLHIIKYIFSVCPQITCTTVACGVSLLIAAASAKPYKVVVYMAKLIPDEIVEHLVEHESQAISVVYSTMARLSWITQPPKIYDATPFDMMQAYIQYIYIRVYETNYHRYQLNRIMYMLRKHGRVHLPGDVVDILAGYICSNSICDNWKDCGMELLWTIDDTRVIQ
jgi:hypothetical protein